MTARRPSPVHRFGRLALAGAAALLTLSGSSPAAPQATVVHRAAPLITGVQLFFGGKPSAGYVAGPTVAAMRALHAVSARDTLPWSELSGLSGAQITSRYPALVDFSHPAAAPAILGITGLRSSIDGGRLPQSPGAVRAFSAFAAGVVAPWSTGSTLFEIWNEWDGGSGHGDPGSPGSYAALVRSAAPAIRAAAPHGLILAGVAADNKNGADFHWTKAMIDAGGLALADALSVHLYDFCEPARLTHPAEEMMGRLDGLHAYAAAHAPGKADIYVSEFGWPTSTGQCGVGPQAAAENVAQFILLASTRPWLRGIWYYELKDGGHDPTNVEDNFGLLDYNYHPKPAFCAYRDAAALVRTAEPVRVTQGGGATRVDFAGKGGPVTAIWLADRTRPMQFRTDAATVQSVCSTALPATPGWVALTARPLLLRGTNGRAVGAVAFRDGTNGT